MSALYLALVHHPVRGRRGETITTSVTNMDIHDIARSCRTYGVKKYFIVTPVKAQHKLLERILGHWERDRNTAYNPDRASALSLTTWRESWGEVTRDIQEEEGRAPLVVATGANLQAPDGGPRELLERQLVDKAPLLVLFGTGHGLAEEVLEGADFRLAPLVGMAPDGYNHLSVRSAVAIYLDRLARSGTG